MKSAATGAVSGCVIWMIVFCILSACLLPVALLVGTLTSTLSIDWVANILGPYLCPQDSTVEIITRKTTGADSNGRPYSATSYEMQCVDSDGNVVREPSQVYVPIWLGSLAVIGLLLSALIAFLLAAPAGVLILNLFNRWRKANSR